MLINRSLKRILLAVSLPLCAGLSSCIMDTYEDLGAGEEIKLKPGSYYMALDFPNLEMGGTRADTDGSLVDGTENGLAESGNFLLLFFGDGKVEYYKMLSSKEMPEELNIETTYVIRMDVEEDYTPPTQMMAFLNAAKYEDQIKQDAENGSLSVANIQKYTWEDYDHPEKIGRDGEHFTMTDSYFQDAQGKTTILADVPVDCIQDADEPFDREKVVHIYVERMLGKCTLELQNSKRDENGYIYYDDGQEQLLFTGFDPDGMHEYFTSVNWRARVTGWGMNALERSSYFMRKTGGNSPLDAWQDPANYRVYWSEDPHYTESDGKYPWQYLPAVNNIDVPYYKDFEDRGINPLKNYSYNDFVEADNFDQPLYVPENTYDISDNYIANHLDNRTPFLAGTHLLVTAVLETDIDHPNTFEARTVLRDRTRILYRTEYDCFRALATSFNYALRSQKEMKFFYYNWDNPSDPNRGKVYYAQSHGSNYSLHLGQEKMNTTNPPTNLSQYFQEADIYNGDGKILMYNPDFNILDDDTKQPIKIFDENGNDVTSQFDHKNIVRSLLMEWVGTVDYFRDGKMYYFKEAKINDKVNGVVRNSWYQYVLTAIKRIGTSVAYPENPIVPNRVFEDQQMIDIRIHILPWHLGLDATIDESKAPEFDKTQSSWGWPAQ